MTTPLNIRLPRDQRDMLDNLAEEKNMSTSEITRFIITDYFSYSKNAINKIENNELILSYEFTLLVFWIYDKLRDPDLNETDEFYLQLTDTIEKLNSHPLLNDEILFELNKISKDIKSKFVDPRDYNKMFKFPSSGNEYSFDYKLFSEFIHSLVYDENQHKITPYDDKY